MPLIVGSESSRFKIFFGMASLWRYFVFLDPLQKMSLNTSKLDSKTEWKASDLTYKSTSNRRRTLFRKFFGIKFNKILVASYNLFFYNLLLDFNKCLVMNQYNVYNNTLRLVN